MECFDAWKWDPPSIVHSAQCKTQSESRSVAHEWRGVYEESISSNNKLCLQGFDRKINLLLHVRIITNN